MSNKQRIAKLANAAAKAGAVPGSPYRVDEGISGAWAMVYWQGVRLDTPLYLRTLDEILERWIAPGRPGWDWTLDGIFGRAAWVALATAWPESTDFQAWFTANGWERDRLLEWFNEPTTLANFHRWEKLAIGEASPPEPISRYSLAWR